MIDRLVITALVTIAALAVAGCVTLTITPTPSPSIASPSASPTQTGGETWLEHLPVDHGIRVGVSAVRLPEPLRTHEARPNHRFVAYDCTVQNVNASGRPVAITYLTAHDTQGNAYTASGASNDVTVSAFKAAAHSQPGDTLGGIVVFAVPSDASIVSITYADGITTIANTVLPV